jgi:ubiquinone biosynthesis protein
MIPRELIPTLLIRPAERPPVVPVAPMTPRGRVLFVVRMILTTAAVVMWAWMRGRLTPAEYGRIVRSGLTRMGAVWIKAGQILSLRGDVCPPEFCVELARLRDLRVAVPFETARRVVEDELGGPLERYFETFTETPFAATSIAQLHRARLRSEGEWVAVKVQHPDARDVFARDYLLIRRLAATLERLGIHPNVAWNGLCRELHDTMTQELDYAYEAASLQRLGRTLRRHGVYVPTVFRPYSGPRVLVMEYIHAALMSDFIALRRADPERLARWLEENGIDPRRVAKRLFESVFRQVLEDNLFHGDLTPENLVLLRDGRLAVLDCRSVGSLEAEKLTNHALYLSAIAHGEYATAADIHFLLSSRLPLVNLDTVKDELVRVWRTWESRAFVRELPPEDKSLTTMFDAVNRVVIRHRFTVQWSMTRLVRTFANLDASLAHLAPDANAVKWMQRYFARASDRAQSADRRTLPRRVDRAVAAAAQLPRMLSETSIFEQTIVRRQAQVIHGSTTKAGALLAAACKYVALVLLLLAALFVSALLDQRQIVAVPQVIGDQWTSLVRRLPQLSTWLWVAVVIAVLLAYRSTIRLATRLARHTVRVPEVPPSV